MPGSIRTGLQRHIDPAWYERVREQLKDSMPVKSPEQGAATSALLAASPLMEGISGRYFEDVNEAEVVPERGGLGGSGVPLMRSTRPTPSACGRSPSRSSPRLEPAPPPMRETPVYTSACRGR